MELTRFNFSPQGSMYNSGELETILAIGAVVDFVLQGDPKYGSIDLATGSVIVGTERTKFYKPKARRRTIKPYVNLEFELQISDKAVQASNLCRELARIIFDDLQSMAMALAKRLPASELALLNRVAHIVSRIESNEAVCAIVGSGRFDRVDKLSDVLFSKEKMDEFFGAFKRPDQFEAHALEFLHQSLLELNEVRDTSQLDYMAKMQTVNDFLSKWRYGGKAGKIFDEHYRDHITLLSSVPVIFAEIAMSKTTVEEASAGLSLQVKGTFGLS